MKWFSISKYKGRGQGLEILNCLSTKNTYFWEIKTPKKNIQNHPDTCSDSLAILTKKFAGWRWQIFFNMKIPGSLPVPITVSELWEWLFPIPSHNSLRERTPLLSSCFIHNSVQPFVFKVANMCLFTYFHSSRIVGWHNGGQPLWFQNLAQGFVLMIFRAKHRFNFFQVCFVA